MTHPLHIDTSVTHPVVCEGLQLFSQTGSQLRLGSKALVVLH